MDNVDVPVRVMSVTVVPFHSTVESIYEWRSAQGTHHYSPGPTTTVLEEWCQPGDARFTQRYLFTSHFQLTVPGPFNQLLYIIAAYVF
jgi:hypothetical protein